MAKHRLETDTESLEWMNSFLVKFWPIFQPVLAETVINSVDQVLSSRVLVDLTLGVGLTRDAPDYTFMISVPIRLR